MHHLLKSQWKASVVMFESGGHYASARPKAMITAQRSAAQKTFEHGRILEILEI